MIDSTIQITIGIFEKVTCGVWQYIAMSLSLFESDFNLGFSRDEEMSSRTCKIFSESL